MTDRSRALAHFLFAESNGPLGAVQRAADAIRDSTSKDAEPNALRNVRLALLSLPRDSSNVPDVPEVITHMLRVPVVVGCYECANLFGFGAYYSCCCGIHVIIALFHVSAAGYQRGGGNFKAEVRCFGLDSYWAGSDALSRPTSRESEENCISAWSFFSVACTANT